MNNKVIFVDDDEALLGLYRNIFDKTDYNIFTESNPEKAIQTIEDERIQVMTFDLKMPGIDGIELCRRIRDKNNIAVIFAITGHFSLFELSEVREAGFDDYFKKPGDIKLLVPAVENAFENLKRWSTT